MNYHFLNSMYYGSSPMGNKSIMNIEIRKNTCTITTEDGPYKTSEITINRAQAEYLIAQLNMFVHGTSSNANE